MIDTTGNTLLAGAYVANINISVKNKNPNNFSPNVTVDGQNGSEIHIKLGVFAIDSISNVDCFITDSSDNALLDCAGSPVTASGSDAGRFQIIANKKNIEVATNPGQFYYNFIWRNTTSTCQFAEVDFTKIGVVPHGAQALHYGIFNGYKSVVNLADWNAVNDATPEGTNAVTTATCVPSGSTLLVTYHLEWSDVGKLLPQYRNPEGPTCATTCPTANQQMSVTGTIKGYNSSVFPIESCTAGAWGYRKL